jgi:membrane fusion protein (multidrug efflux system)
MAARMPQFCMVPFVPLDRWPCSPPAARARAPRSRPAAAPPPPEVGVVTVATGDVGLVTELPGRLEASRVAQVRARAAGIVQKRLFREGSDVKAGQVLFRIDSAPYKAANASAQAALARAQANLAQASALAERYKPLVEANAISKQEYANAVAARSRPRPTWPRPRRGADAEINLGYASVTAPISGRIGRALVTEGALVGQGEATPLAVIQQINPLYVNFTQSATEVMKLRRALESGQLKRAPAPKARRCASCWKTAPNTPQPGRCCFRPDRRPPPARSRCAPRCPTRGHAAARHVRARALEQAKAANAMLLPQQAVTRSPRATP